MRMVLIAFAAGAALACALAPLAAQTAGVDGHDRQLRVQPASG